MEKERLKGTKKSINDMVRAENGKVSNSKVWALVASAVATWIVIYMTLHGKMDWEILLAYLGTVGGFSQVSQWMAYKYGNNTPKEEKPKKTDEGSD